MPETVLILEIDKPHFSVKLYENMLKIDLHGTIKNNIEEALENTPLLRETIGHIFGVFVPLHIHLNDIDLVKINEKGNVKIVLPRHRDIVIPLNKQDSKKLSDKLNQLIPKAKEEELKRIMQRHRLRKIAEAEYELAKEKVAIPTIGAVMYPTPEPEGVLKKEKEAEEETEKEQEK